MDFGGGPSRSFIKLIFLALGRFRLRLFWFGVCLGLGSGRLEASVRLDGELALDLSWILLDQRLDQRRSSFAQGKGVISNYVRYV
jgi:hypothetical protein